MAPSDTHAGEVAQIRERLARLDAERADLERRLAGLTHPTSAQLASAGPVGTDFSSEDQGLSLPTLQEGGIDSIGEICALSNPNCGAAFT